MGIPANPEIRKALFALSRGKCYAPDCQQPIIRVIDGEPVVNVLLSYICSHSSQGPRCLEEIAKEQRRRFKNILLLCSPHRAIIRYQRNHKFPEAQLRSWKRDREGDVGPTLAGLANLTERRLQRMFIEAITANQQQLSLALNRLSVINREAADVFRRITTDPLIAPCLDVDAVASLADLAYRLRNQGIDDGWIADIARLLRPLAWGAHRADGAQPGHLPGGDQPSIHLNRRTPGRSAAKCPTPGKSYEQQWNKYNR